jgi:hypothetical protein
MLDPRFEVVEAGRGGKYTYHGPGQRVGYLLLDLKKRARDVRGFVHALEGWVIDTLGDFGVEAWRSEAGVGIWTRDIDGSEAKIGAIGVRIRRWVTMHGFAVNLAPDLGHFTGIVPCGIAERASPRWRGWGWMFRRRRGMRRWWRAQASSSPGLTSPARCPKGTLVDAKGAGSMMKFRGKLLTGCAVLAASLALAGCGWFKKTPKADDQRTASGQILPGSISDAMIAYDALTSQPPVAPRSSARKAPPPRPTAPPSPRPRNPAPIPPSPTPPRPATERNRHGHALSPRR